MGKGFWNLPQTGSWLVTWTLEGKLGFERRECCARNGLQQAWHFLLLFLEFQIQGRREASHSNPLTKSGAWTSLPSLSSAPEVFLPTQLLSYVWDLESERPGFTLSSSTLSLCFLICKTGCRCPPLRVVLSTQ